jgi:hypothetical protein
MTPSSFILDFFAHSAGWVFVCSLPNERGNGRAAEVCGRDNGARLDELVTHKWDKPDRGTFFCINTVKPKQAVRSKETVHEIVTLHADLDFAKIETEPDAILRQLATLEYPPSKVVHSGHGYHCYWLLSEALPVTPELIVMVETALRGLADMLGGDPAVCEIARLMRVPGSHNTKNGERLPVEAIVDSDRRYELDDLCVWIAETRVLIPRKGAAQSDNPFLAVDMPSGGPPVDVDARLAAMRYQGEGGDSVYQTQISVTAALLNRGESIDEAVHTVLGATRKAASAIGERWDWRREEKDLRRMCETWAKKTNGQQPQPQPQDDTLMTFEELGAMQFEPAKFLVEGLIPAEGVTLICSKPKAGKSWLVLDLVLSATMDRDCLGNRRPLQGSALLLALEDSKRRLRSRGEKLLAEHFGDWPASAVLATRWPRFDQDGLARIRQWALGVKANGGTPVLAVIDVLKMVRPAGQEKKTIYAQDYECLQGLRALAHELSLAVVVTHHVRKTAADDAQDTVSGSLGLSASADCTIVLERQTDGNFVLDARGRDVEHVQLAAIFDKETCRWRVTGDAAESRRSETRRAILAVLGEAPDGMAPAEICAATGLKAGATRMALFRMVKDGEVRKERGRYVLARKKGPLRNA